MTNENQSTTRSSESVARPDIDTGVSADDRQSFAGGFVGETFPNGKRERYNFTGSPKDVWLLCSKATGAGVKDSDEFPASGAGIQYAYQHIVPVESKTAGEINNAVRTVLFCDNGERYGFVSTGITSDVERMFDVFGYQKWEPALHVKLDIIKTRKGFKMMTLTPIE